MTSRGPKAPRVAKRKHGGLCKDCPNKQDFKLDKEQVSCSAVAADVPRWRLIPRSVCPDHPEYRVARSIPAYIEAPRQTAGD